SAPVRNCDCQSRERERRRDPSRSSTDGVRDPDSREPRRTPKHPGRGGCPQADASRRHVPLEHHLARYHPGSKRPRFEVPKRYHLRRKAQPGCRHDQLVQRLDRGLSYRRLPWASATYFHCKFIARPESDIFPVPPLTCYLAVRSCPPNRNWWLSDA